MRNTQGSKSKSNRERGSTFHSAFGITAYLPLKLYFVHKKLDVNQSFVRRTTLTSERSLLPRALSLLCAALLLAGCSKPAGPVVLHKTVGDLAVTFTADPPPHIGDNSFRVLVADTVSSAPVGNANITVDPEMLSHIGTGTKTSGRSQGNGAYLLPVRLGIATRYDISLHIERPGKPAADVSFPIEAVQ